MGATSQLHQSSGGILRRVPGPIFGLLPCHRYGHLNSWLAAILLELEKPHCRWCLLLPRINLRLLERRPFLQHHENRIKAAAVGTRPYRAHYRDTSAGGLSTGLDYPSQIPERNARLMSAKRQMPQPHSCMWGHNFMHTHLWKVAFFRSFNLSVLASILAKCCSSFPVTIWV